MSASRIRASELRRMAAELGRMADEIEGASILPARGLSQVEARDETPWSLRSIAHAAYRARRDRDRFFPADLFFEPAWDMLLDLFVAACDEKMIPTTSLSIASGVAPSTALRYIDHLVETGMAQRCEDGSDARRTFVTITEQGRQAMADYLSHIRGVRFGNTPEMVLVANRAREVANNE